jgi:hypothetical protein
MAVAGRASGAKINPAATIKPNADKARANSPDKSANLATDWRRGTNLAKGTNPGRGINLAKAINRVNRATVQRAGPARAKAINLASPANPDSRAAAINSRKANSPGQTANPANRGMDQAVDRGVAKVGKGADKGAATPASRAMAKAINPGSRAAATNSRRANSPGQTVNPVNRGMDRVVDRVAAKAGKGEGRARVVGKVDNLVPAKAVNPANRATPTIWRRTINHRRSWAKMTANSL